MDVLSVLNTINIVIIAIGIACNGSVLLIIISGKVNSSPRNYLLANIALGDLFLLVTSGLLSVLIDYEVLNNFDKIVCLSTNASIVISQGVAVLTLMSLSMDRFLAIVHPFAILRLRPGKIYGTVIVLIWIISLVVATPIFFLGNADKAINNSYCHYVPEYTRPGRIYDCVRAALFYVLPLSVIGVSYVLMAHRIFRSTAFAKRSSNSSRRVQKERQKLGILVLAIVVLFAVCWAPATFYSIYKHYKFVNVELYFFLESIHLKEWRSTLIFINACTNPIILYLMSKSYREGFVKLVSWKTRSSSRFTSIQTSLSSIRSRHFIRIKEGHELSQLGEKTTPNDTDGDA
ncbi:gastrin-releasing peptide receptor-like [Anneissia japonica]|uniref:gastrin-releasing peptide receptor-like n=1 Tax=Anneissia japonica TaxID=1529436 RepID=UPI001425A0C6|nr:gastrin-releasing peptide receptor-like [Anneissia japonica]XP_033119722.1 gastrin-releasing peptide receptor-like [Anneissia japonica]